jgi:hypothetical protein
LRIAPNVQPFPAAGGKWQISTNGGVGPEWSPKGDEIFYIASDGKLMNVQIKTAGTFEAGIPKPVLDMPLGQRD